MIQVTNFLENHALAEVKSKTNISSGIKRLCYKGIKRSFDITCGLIGIVVLVPLALIIKISYILTGDFNSIFFTQSRIGKDGKEFKFYKFRTMVPDADEKLFKYLEENEDAAKEYKENKKLKNDPRITKMGKLLRKTSLDEFPQVINCLSGKMAIIGNRPYLPREKEDMGIYYNDIIKTKPGITGYWQVSGRNDVSFKRRLELETYYSNNCSFKLDLKIFLKTFKTVLGMIGAL